MRERAKPVARLGRQINWAAVREGGTRELRARGDWGSDTGDEGASRINTYCVGQWKGIEPAEMQRS